MDLDQLEIEVADVLRNLMGAIYDLDSSPYPEDRPDTTDELTSAYQLIERLHSFVKGKVTADTSRGNKGFGSTGDN